MYQINTQQLKDSSSNISMTVETLAVSVFVARDREKKTLHKYILHKPEDADEAGDEIKRYSIKSY